MNYGFYAAFLGMRVRQRTLDVIANNIANASTTGFKAERLHYRSVEAAEVERLRAAEQGRSSPGQPPPESPNAAQATASAASSPASSAERLDRAFGVVASSLKDLAPGSVRETGKPLDLAIQGDGYFAVQTPRGERYTRAGSFTLDADGQLVTQRGELVIGERGPITLPPGEISVGEDGTLAVAGRTVDRLKVVRFTNAQHALTREGDTLFAATSSERPTQAASARVVQGVVESSNVNVVSEMAAMMQNSREFDSLQRSVKLMMDIRQAASEIGKI